MLYKKLLWLIAQQSDDSNNIPDWTPGTHTFSFVASQDGSASLFDSTTPDIHPVDSFTVTINGVLTDQSYQSISFAANDEVVITGNDVVSFPKIVSGSKRYFASVSTLPFMTTGENAAACESANDWFRGSSDLVTVPGDLFINNPYLYDFHGTFAWSGLVNIPSSLFEYVASNRSLTFVETFAYCKALTSLPSDLFKTCTNATSFNNAFQGCSGLTSLPNDLLKTCTKAINFAYTFQGCSGLTSLPNDLFKTCTSVIQFLSTFADCTNLVTLPESLFASNSKLKAFTSTFSYCKGLLTIPSNLFANNPEVELFNYTFDSCTNLSSIPENLFANNPKVTDFGGAFYGCTNLSSIPENLFANNPEVTSFDRTFYICRNLSSIPENLFANNPKVTSFEDTFIGCTNLLSVPENLFANNLEVTDFDYTFSSCGWANTLDGRKVRLKIGSPNVTSCTQFCSGSGIDGSITIAVPAGSTTEATFRAYAETDAKVVIETF